MARYPNAADIYKVAELFAEECILKDGSFFWPDRAVWTLENIDTFWREFALKPDVSADNFITKWSKQLEGQSDDVYRMAYEVTALYCLFPHKSGFGPGAKRALLESVLSMGRELGSRDDPRVRLLESAISGDGIGKPGAGYLNKRPFHIGFLLAFVASSKNSGMASLRDADAKQLVHAAMARTIADMKFTPTSSLNSVLHLFWPDSFESTASADQKRLMATNLSKHFGLVVLDDVDDTIFQVRSHMENQDYPKNFSMYDPGIRSLWDASTVQSPSPKYALAELFHERVIQNRQSFLWPEAMDIWTHENAARALDLVKPLAGQGFEEAMSQLSQIIETSQAPIHRILCDTRAASILSRSLGPTTAARWMGWMVNAHGDFDGDKAVLDEVISTSNSKFPGCPSSGGNTPVIDQFLIILHGITTIIAHPKTIGNRDAIVQNFMSQPLEPTDGLMYFPFWSLLHLFYPEDVAPIPGYMDRETAFRAFSNLTKGKDYPNYHAKLADIRSKLKPDFDPYTFDFYASPWVEQWRHKSPNGSTEGVATGPDDGNDLDGNSSNIGRLATETHLPESKLREIEELLGHKKQLIFEGPPGSGKTFVAEKFARYFTGQSLDQAMPRNEQIEMIQFHQSYSYEDFVEGIRPETKEGQIHYTVKPGIFRVFCDRALANEDKNFVLIIDEINRGNISRILGELMLLLEYRGETATLQYSQDKLTIPPNLYIIGTMNSADRSLSQIDYALRRRFNFVKFMSVEDNIAPVLSGWLEQRGLAPADRETVTALFVDMNTRLRDVLHTDDLQVGHSYFMREDIHTVEVRRTVAKYAVLPLLDEYFYNRPDRATLLSDFEHILLAMPTVVAEDPAEESEVEPEVEATSAEEI